ncbi:hypothetical protein [Parasphingorhabdus sp. NYA22]
MKFTIAYQRIRGDRRSADDMFHLISANDKKWVETGLTAFKERT